MASKHDRPGEQREELKLADAAQTLLDECRMVLPGIQAILGFQLIAVFNERFAKELEASDQHLHVLAMSFVALAVGLVMTPAAFHRTHGAQEITDTFVHVSSVLLLASMIPLALGLSIDFHLIAKLVFGGEGASRCFGGALFALLFTLWFIFPRLHGVHAAIARARGHLVAR